MKIASVKEKMKSAALIALVEPVAPLARIAGEFRWFHGQGLNALVAPVALLGSRGDTVEVLRWTACVGATGVVELLGRGGKGYVCKRPGNLGIVATILGEFAGFEDCPRLPVAML